MEYDRNKAESSMAQLKNAMLDVIMDMGRAGTELAENHERYAKEGKRMKDLADVLQQRCEESLFSIALGAAFQSGKSTTVNALADGREICPRGNGGGGIRTSSCAVRVGCSLDGRARSSVIWQTPEELDRSLRYALGEENSDVTLHDPEHVAWAWRRVVKRAEDAAHDPQSFGERERDQIKQAFLMLAFFDHPQAREYMARDQFTEAETRSFMAFSSDVILRWNRVFRGAAGLGEDIDALRALVREQFTVEQAMYVFISTVNYATPSEYLHSLGVQVVDTPGLNMSDNDTRVALHAMQEASAIFYFFSGERQLDEADKQGLRLIQSCGLADKVFFGINFRRSLSALTQIEGAILADLEMLGYDRPHQKEMLHYNAFLAQRAKQGLLMLEGNLDEEGRAAIMREAEQIGAECETVEEAWLETTDAVMRTVRAEGWRDFYDNGLTEENVEVVLRASRWQETMDAINDYVLRNRGNSVLVNGLSTPVRTVLSEIETVLQADEDEADQHVDELTQQYDEAIRRFDAFAEESEKAVREAITPDWDRKLAEDFYVEVYLGSVNDAAEMAAQEIQKESNLKRNLGQLGNTALNKLRELFGGEKKKSELECITENAINRALTAAIEQHSIKWEDGFEKSQVYKATIGKGVSNLSAQLMSMWTEMGMDENEALRRLRKQLESKLPKGKFGADFQLIQLTLRESTLLRSSGEQTLNWLSTMFKGLGVGTAAVLGTGFVYLCVLPTTFVLPLVGEIAMLAGAAYIAIHAFMTNISPKSAQKELEKLTESLRNAFYDQLDTPEAREQHVRSLIDGNGASDQSGLQFYRQFYLGAFESALALCRDDLEKGKQAVQTAARQSEAERQRIAAEANDIRTNIIGPMRTRMEILEATVREIAATEE